MDLLGNQVVKAYLFYGTVVLGKTLFLGPLTSFTRLFKKVYANPEDTKLNNGIVKFDDLDIERIRRCHLNDLENVYMFVLLGAFYCATNPTYSTALWHFRIFTAARTLHTIVYLNKVPQPTRAIAFGAGAAVCASMIFNILKATF